MVKKVPLRKCIACGNMYDKRELIRVIRSSEGVYSIDFTGKANGRGAYVCNSEECINKCLKTRALNRAFKENIPDDIYRKLSEEYEQSKN